MARLEVIDSGILYINPDPAHYHVSAFFPHPLQLSAKEFICTYQRGAGMYAADSNVALLRSLDGGVTWTHERFLFNKTDDDRPYSYHDGMMSRMSDGTFAVLSFRADRSDPNKPMFSESGGLIENEPILIFSRDGGRTWTKPLPFALPEGMVATPANPVIELEDGRWLATFDQWHGYDDSRLYQPRMWAFFSADQGCTWGDKIVIADGGAEDKGFWHGKTIRMSDGQLYTLFWAADMTDRDKGPVDLPIHYSIADKTGQHWSAPKPTVIPG